MNNNSILQTIQFALHLETPHLEQIFALVNIKLEPNQLIGYFIDTRLEDYIACPNNIVRAFLDGLILYKRGPSTKPLEEFSNLAITNNAVLKKLRIAMDFHEEDVRLVLERARADVKNIDLSGIFRKEGHKNYKKCDDQVIIAFLIGIRLAIKKPVEQSAPTDPI